MKTATPATHRQPLTAHGSRLTRGVSHLVLTGHGLFQAQGSWVGDCLALGLRPDGNFGGGSSFVRCRQNLVSLGQKSLLCGKDSVDDGQSLVRDGSNLFIWEETFSMTNKTQSVTDRVFSMPDKTLSVPDKTQSVTNQTASAPDKTPSAAQKAACRAETMTSAPISPLSGRQWACSKTQ